jgi:hypothetical protein
MVSVPFSRKKHYLTGMDWIVHAFDYMNRAASGAGNMFQIVMEMDGVPAEREVRDFLERFDGKCPVLSGRVRRDYNLAPYWKIPLRGRKAALPLTIHRVEEEEDVSRLLERAANTPFGSKSEHLALLLISTGERSYAAVTFDHCLFDAQGAEAFLSMLQHEWEKRGACSWELPVFGPAHLSQWRRKFEAGRQVNRAFLRLAENAPPRVLPLPRALSRRGFRFRVISFSERQSEEIMERADSEAGYLMAMPYTLAVSVQLLHAIFAKRATGEGDYIIPVTMDTRPRSEMDQEVFFNHVSFLFFRIQAGEVEDFSALVGSIKQQMYEQTKAGLSRDLWEASFLTRIVPLPVLSRLMRVYFKGEVASFCFSFLGEAERSMTHFMGREVRRSYHMTRVPLPPGLGVFFQQSKGRLNAYLSYAQGLLSEDEADAIADGLESRLGG